MKISIRQLRATSDKLWNHLEAAGYEDVAMSVLDRIAHFQNHRDEVPNQVLARELAEMRDKAGVREIATNLWNDNAEVQSDCVKVLYEAGALEPRLIAGYADDFLKLLGSNNNRLVWGGTPVLAAQVQV